MEEGIYEVIHDHENHMAPKFFAFYSGEDLGTTFTVHLGKNGERFKPMMPFDYDIIDKELSSLTVDDFLGNNPSIRRIFRDMIKIGDLDKIYSSFELPRE